MWGQTWLSPHPRPLILRMPPPYGFTLNIRSVQCLGSRHNIPPPPTPPDHDLHMYRFMISLVSCFPMGETQGLNSTTTLSLATYFANAPTIGFTAHMDVIQMNPTQWCYHQRSNMSPKCETSSWSIFYQNCNWFFSLEICVEFFTMTSFKRFNELGFFSCIIWSKKSGNFFPQN
jgi:hypothetical protein